MHFSPGRFQPYSDYEADAEVAELQTDIMRFMAILGFCLMVIFAVVQSIPYEKESPPTTLSIEDQLIEINTDLKQQVTLLGHEIKVMQSELEQSRQQLTRIREQHQQEDSSQQLITAQLTEQLQQVEKTVSSRDAEIQQLNVKLERKQVESERLKQMLSEQQTLQQAANEQLKQLQNNLHKAEQQLLSQQQLNSLNEQKRRELDQKLQTQALEKQELKRQALAKRQQQVKTAQTRASATPVKSQNKGFSLGFDSDDALLGLVRKHSVELYAMIGRKTWQLSMQAGKVRWQSVKTPSQYYQMDRTTVPELVKRKFHRSVAAHNRDSVIWGVGLPGQMKSQIRSLMNQHQGGDLSIDSSGRVILE